MNNRVYLTYMLESFLPFFFLLAQYKIFYVNLGVIGLIFIALVRFSNNDGMVYIAKAYKFFVIFLLFSVCNDIIKMIICYGEIQSRINGIIEYLTIYGLVLFLCTTDSFNEEKLYKMWKIAGTIYILGLVYHVIQLAVFHQMISPIMLLPGYSFRGEASSARPCSFFSEPAAFCVAIIPLLFLALKRKEYYWAAISTVAMFLSTSTVGIILSTVLWMLALLRRRLSMREGITTILVAGIVVLLFVNMEVFAPSREKLLEVFAGGSTFGSRVVTGLTINLKQSFLSQLFGADYLTADDYVANNIDCFLDSEIVMAYWRAGRLFLNTFSQIIFRYGMVGLFVLMIPFIRLIRQPDYQAKDLIIMCGVAIFGESMLLNSYFFMMLMLILLYDNQNLITNGYR